MKKLLLPLFVVLALLAACSQQATEETTSEPSPESQKTQAAEATLDPQTAGQTPEPTAEPTPDPYAVSAAFVDEITSDIPYGLLEGLDKEIYEPLLDYYHSFEIVQTDDQILLRFLFEDNSFTQTIQESYEAKWGPFENGCLELDDTVGMGIGEIDGETCVEFLFFAADYPDFKTPDYYSKQIQLPEMPEEACLVDCRIKGFERGEEVLYECTYELPEDRAQTIIADCESSLSELTGYVAFEGMEDDFECMEYEAVLAPGAKLYAFSTQEMFLFDVTVTPLTILNSGFAYEAAADPAGVLLSADAANIYSMIAAANKSAAADRGEDMFSCNLFFEFFEDADAVAQSIADAYGVEDSLELLQDMQDIEIPLEQGSITIYGSEYPQALRIIVETWDETSLQKMNEVFSHYPDDLLPEFPESIPSEFVCNSIWTCNGAFTYSKTYVIDQSDYNSIVNYFKNLFESEYGDTWVEEYGNRSTNIETSFDNIQLEVFVDKGDEYDAPHVDIQLVN